MQESTNVEVKYKIQKDGSGVAVFLNDLPILLLPPEHFYNFTKLTLQVARELKKYEREQLVPAEDLALGFSKN